MHADGGGGGEDDEVVVLAIHRPTSVAHSSHTHIDLTTAHHSALSTPPFPVPSPQYLASWAGDGRSKRLALDLTSSSPSPPSPPRPTLSQLAQTLSIRPPLRRKKPPTTRSPLPTPSFLPFPPLSIPPSSSSPSRPRIDHLSALPTDLLKEVLSHLDGAEAFFSLSAVSGLFHRLLSSSSSLLSSASFDFSPYGGLVRLTSLTHCIASAAPDAMRRLSLARCSALTSAAITSAITPLVALTRLDLSSTAVATEDVGIIACACRALVDLRVDLSVHPRLTPAVSDVHPVFSLPSLRLLDASGWGLTDALLLAVDGRAQLTHLSIHHNGGVGNHSLLQMHCLLSPALVYLDLSHTALSSGLFQRRPRLHDTTGAPAVALPALRCLNIATTAHSSLTSEDVEAILDASPLLRCIDLSGHTQVASFSPTDHCPKSFPHLTSLTLSRCWRIRHSALASIPLLFPSLTALSLSSMQLNDRDLLALAESSLSANTCGHRLRSLDLGGNIAVTNAGVMRVMEVMDGLRLLSVGGCPWVEDGMDGLSEWIKTRRKGAGVVLPSPGASWAEERERMEARRRWQPPIIARSARPVASNRMDDFP